MRDPHLTVLFNTNYPEYLRRCLCEAGQGLGVCGEGGGGGGGKEVEESSGIWRPRRERNKNRSMKTIFQSGVLLNMEQTYFASRSQTGLNLLLIISQQKREGKKLQQKIKINLAEISDWTNSKLKEIISYLDDLISVKKFSTEF